MQVLQAGQHKLIFLELEPELVANIAKQAGFEAKLKDTQRSITLDLTAAGRQAPLLLFDAADPANLGWFSRCQFYIDGRSGGVMQTPISLANKRDRGGKAQPYSVRVNIAKELPASFRLPGKQPLTEQVSVRAPIQLPQRADENRRGGLRRKRRCRRWRAAPKASDRATESLFPHREIHFDFRGHFHGFAIQSMWAERSSAGRLPRAAGINNGWPLDRAQVQDGAVTRNHRFEHHGSFDARLIGKSRVNRARAGNELALLHHAANLDSLHGHGRRFHHWRRTRRRGHTARQAVDHTIFRSGRIANASGHSGRIAGSSHKRDVFNGHNP